MTTERKNGFKLAVLEFIENIHIFHKCGQSK